MPDIPALNLRPILVLLSVIIPTRIDHALYISSSILISNSRYQATSSQLRHEPVTST